MIVAAVRRWCSSAEVAKDLGELQLIKAGSET